MSLRAHHRHAWSMDGQCRTRPRQSHRSLHPRPCRRLLRRQDLDHLARVFRKLRRRNVEFFIGRALKGDAQHHPRPVHGHPVSRSGVAYQPPCLPPPPYLSRCCTRQRARPPSPFVLLLCSLSASAVAEAPFPRKGGGRGGHKACGPYGEAARPPPASADHATTPTRRSSGRRVRHPPGRHPPGRHPPGAPACVPTAAGASRGRES
eukprot:SAG25_NODE_183_length_12476_cov_9.734427_2_plen_206_part_00